MFEPLYPWTDQSPDASYPGKGACCWKRWRSLAEDNVWRANQLWTVYHWHSQQLGEWVLQAWSDGADSGSTLKCLLLVPLRSIYFKNSRDSFIRVLVGLFSWVETLRGRLVGWTTAPVLQLVLRLDRLQCNVGGPNSMVAAVLSQALHFYQRPAACQVFCFWKVSNFPLLVVWLCSRILGCSIVILMLEFAVNSTQCLSPVNP